MAKFTSLFTNISIALAICRYLPSLDVVRLRRVCVACRKACNFNENQLFNIHSHLLEFFAEPNDFRALQARTGAVISGSFALQFFSRTTYPEADLDLYIHNDVMEEVGTWLLNRGYWFVRDPKADPDRTPPVPETVNHRLMMLARYRNALREVERNGQRMRTVYMPDCLGVLNFVTKRGEHRRIVQVIVVYSTPLAAILRFHSSKSVLDDLYTDIHPLSIACVLNFITYDYAFCLYPEATIKHKVTLALKRITASVDSCLNKYAIRGFDCIRVASPEQRAVFCLDKVRWAEDGHGWRIELPRLAMIPFGSDYTSPATVATWSIVTRVQDGHYIHFNIWSHDEHPSIFPIIIATEFIQDIITDTFYTMVEHNDTDEKTCTGGDM